MLRIAHLSDVHLLDRHATKRRGWYAFATRLVSLGRPIDPGARADKLARALAHAKAGGADHVVISGDLTEVGDPREFEAFAEVLHDARWPEGSITLVPGNHDVYTTRDAWAKAIRGPFAPFAAASAAAADAQPRVVERGNVVILPIDSTCFQNLLFSGGIVERRTVDALSARLSERPFRDRTQVLVIHHPPLHSRVSSVRRWIVGLRGSAAILELLARHPRLQLLHGHLHRILDQTVRQSHGPGVGADPQPCGSGVLPRILGARATCDGGSAVRFYEVIEGSLAAVTPEETPPQMREGGEGREGGDEGEERKETRGEATGEKDAA